MGGTKIRLRVALAIGIVIFLIFIGVKSVALADENVADSAADFTYTVNSDGIYITGLAEGDYTKIDIPSEIEGKKVVKINANAFSGNTSITDIVVPDSVTSIGEGAFKGTGLESITLPFVGKSRSKSPSGSEVYDVFGIVFGRKTSSSNTGVQDAVIQFIGKGESQTTYHFYSIPKTLKSVKITDATQIPKNAFYNCDFIEKIELNEGIETIGQYAFYNCIAISEIDLPDSITSMGSNAFYNCTSLQKANIPQNMPIVSEGMFYGCTLLKEVKTNELITEIGKQAFYNCKSIENIEMPDTITNIGEKAFNGCKYLKEISIPNVESIGAYAFYECEQIDDVEFSYKLDSIGTRAFFGCSNITEIEVPDSVTSIDEGAFMGTSLESITLPFVGKSRSKSPSGSEVYDVFGIVFGRKTSSSSTGVQDAVIQFIGKGESQTTYHFYSIPKTLKSVKITDATQIPKNAFYNCDFIEKIELNEGIETIGQNAFYNCKDLKSIIIPDSVQSIGSNAFKGCEDIAIYANKGTAAYNYAKNNNLNAFSTKDLSIDKHSMTLYKDSTESIEVSVTMLNGEKDTSPNVVWNSSDENVVVVNAGMVEVKGPGHATITATCEGFSDTCEITVYYLLEAISLDENDTTIDINDSKKLEVAYEPSNTTDDKTINWTSSDTDVISVSSDGTITGVSKGKATITAESVMGPTDSIEIEALVPITSIDIAESNITLERGGSKKLTLSVAPNNTTDTYEWSSSDPSIIEVDQEGNVTAKKAGKATITVTTSREKKDSCVVNSIVSATDISLDKTSLSVFVDDSISLEPTMTPSDTTDKATWSSSNNSVIKISNNNIQIVAAGTAKLTARTTSGKEAYCNVTVDNDIKAATIVLSKDKYGYTGSAIVPGITLKYGNKTIATSGYSVECSNNTAIGTATIKVNGNGRYSGTLESTFEIVENRLQKENIEVDLSDELYTGNAIEKTISVSYDGKQLKKNTDYKVTYSNNTNIGTASIVVEGKGVYCGTVEYNFEIIQDEFEAFKAAMDKSGGSISSQQGTVNTSGYKAYQITLDKSTNELTLSKTFYYTGETMTIEYVYGLYTDTFDITYNRTGAGRTYVYQSSVNASELTSFDNLTYEDVNGNGSNSILTNAKSEMGAAFKELSELLLREIGISITDIGIESYSHTHYGGTADCTNKAKCSICGQEYGESNGHLPVLQNEKKANYDEDGYTGDEVCEVCGEILKRGNVINKPSRVAATGKYKQLKDYILANGMVDFNGDLFIGFTDKEIVKEIDPNQQENVYAISYSSKDAKFIFRVYFAKSYKLEFSIDENGSNIVYVYCYGPLALNDATTSFYASTYVKGSNIDFTMKYAEANDPRYKPSFVRTWNSILKLGFVGWDIILGREFGLDINMGNLGFISYEEPGDHTWNEGEITRQPTGSTEGVKTYTCTICGETKTESIPANGIDDNPNNGSSNTNNQGGSSDKKTSNYKNEWINGKWYNADGTQTYKGTLQWKCNATGWWVEDTDGWYPQDSWQKIDGVWYYFKPDGYMASNEYYKGYWFNSNGSWDDQYFLSWKSNSTGWWVEDKSGWWPSSSWLKIDGCWYYFDSSGYMVTSRYIDGWWIDADGVCR